MMKRSNVVHYFICLILGMAVGSFLLQAVQDNSMANGVVAIMATVACILNVACGPDESIKKNNDKK